MILTEALEAAASEFGESAAWHAGDVADEDAVKAAIAKTQQAFGTIREREFCRNWRCCRTVGKDRAMPLARFEHIVRVNLIGTFNVLRLCAEGDAA